MGSLMSFTTSGSGTVTAAPIGIANSIVCLRGVAGSGAGIDAKVYITTNPGTGALVLIAPTAQYIAHLKTSAANTTDTIPLDYFGISVPSDSMSGINEQLIVVVFNDADPLHEVFLYFAT